MKKEETRKKSEEILYPAGIKWTRQRKEVYQILREEGHPLSALEIYNRILKNMSGQDRAASYAVSTVYRILSVFEEKGLVNRSVLTGEEAAVYELNRGEHTHFAICLGCHKKLPLGECPMSHFHVPVSSDEFMVTGHRIEVYGYCSQCRKKQAQ